MLKGVEIKAGVVKFASIAHVCACMYACMRAWVREEAGKKSCNALYATYR